MLIPLSDDGTLAIDVSRCAVCRADNRSASGTLSDGTACLDCLSAFVCARCLVKGKWHMVKACRPAGKLAAVALRAAAERGDKLAASYLAGAYCAGELGLQSDFAQAHKWYGVAASSDAPDPAVLNQLGLLHMRGHGTAMDYARALQLFEAADARGYTNAAANIGFMLLNGGPGLARDLPRSFAFTKKAAEAGDVGGMMNLSLAYAQGAGTPVDMELAARWGARARATPSATRRT